MLPFKIPQRVGQMGQAVEVHRPHQLQHLPEVLFQQGIGVIAAGRHITEVRLAPHQMAGRQDKIQRQPETASAASRRS